MTNISIEEELEIRRQRDPNRFFDETESASGSSPNGLAVVCEPATEYDYSGGASGSGEINWSLISANRFHEE